MTPSMVDQTIIDLIIILSPLWGAYILSVAVNIYFEMKDKI